MLGLGMPRRSRNRPRRCSSRANRAEMLTAELKAERERTDTRTPDNSGTLLSITEAVERYDVSTVTRI